jgi:hypothetical protein
VSIYTRECLSNAVSIPLVLQMTIKYKFKRTKIFTKITPPRAMKLCYVLLLTQTNKIDVDRVIGSGAGTMGVDGKSERK